ARPCNAIHFSRVFCAWRGGEASCNFAGLPIQAICELELHGTVCACRFGGGAGSVRAKSAPGDAAMKALLISSSLSALVFVAMGMQLGLFGGNRHASND